MFSSEVFKIWRSFRLRVCDLYSKFSCNQILVSNGYAANFGNIWVFVTLVVVFQHSDCILVVQISGDSQFHSPRIVKPFHWFSSKNWRYLESDAELIGKGIFAENTLIFYDSLTVVLFHTNNISIWDIYILLAGSLMASSPWKGECMYSMSITTHYCRLQNT